MIRRKNKYLKIEYRTDMPRFYPIFVWHKKIIKPWKQNEYSGNKKIGYADGWNDCLKEMEKNHKKFMAFFQEKFIQNPENEVKKALENLLGTKKSPNS